MPGQGSAGSGWAHILMLKQLGWGLTFDMSGGAKGAKRPLGRPLDGGVRTHALRAWSLTRFYVCAVLWIFAWVVEPEDLRAPSAMTNDPLSHVKVCSGP